MKGKYFEFTWTQDLAETLCQGRQSGVLLKPVRKEYRETLTVNGAWVQSMQIFYSSITSIDGRAWKEIELTGARLADVTTVRRPDMNQLKFKYPLTQDKRFYMTADGEHLDTWAHSRGEHMIGWFMAGMTNAPINVKPTGGRRQGMGWGGDLTFPKLGSQIPCLLTVEDRGGNALLHVSCDIINWEEHCKRRSRTESMTSGFIGFQEPSWQKPTRCRVGNGVKRRAQVACSEAECTINKQDPHGIWCVCQVASTS